MRLALTFAVAALLAPRLAAAQELKTEDEKTLYAVGLVEAQRLSVFAPSKPEVEAIKRGITDGLTGAKPLVDLNAYGPKIAELVKARAPAKQKADEEKAKKEKEKGEAFEAKAAKEPGVKKTASGLLYKDIKAGTGPSPAKTDSVKVNYRGTLTDGTEFDSSYKRGQPAEFGLSQVIPCWTEGVGMMKVGGKARLICPSSIAYGDTGHPPMIPGGATLVFEVELLEIKAPPPPPAPKAEPAQPKQ